MTFITKSISLTLLILFSLAGCSLRKEHPVHETVHPDIKKHLSEVESKCLAKRYTQSVVVLDRDGYRVIDVILSDGDDSDEELR
jgi:hypothetical protein